jgi:hypothetical protein
MVEILASTVKEEIPILNASETIDVKARLCLKPVDKQNDHSPLIAHEK